MTSETAAATDRSLIGQCIDDRYQLEAVIGVGGLGSVYRAVHTKLQRPVAIKLLHENLGVSELQRARFAREATALAALEHPNIVAVLDYGVSGERPYLVMELLQGETLSRRLQRGPLALDTAVWISRELLAGLAFMHRARLVHRDVKPSNVFLQRREDGQERVKVLDFGLAKFTAPALATETGDPTLTRDGAIVGTPAYMSPEQATGEVVDARGDVYAAGVILFRMLTGRLPFEGDAIELVRSHLVAPVPALERPQPDPAIDVPLEALIHRAMAKAREGRFADAAEMLGALLEIFPVDRASGPVQPVPTPVQGPGFAELDPSDYVVLEGSSDVPTTPRPHTAPLRLRERAWRAVNRARLFVIAGARVFSALSALLVIAAAIILILLIRDEQDRAELSALQQRLSERLIERSLRGGSLEPAGTSPPAHATNTQGVKPARPILTAGAHAPAKRPSQGPDSARPGVVAEAVGVGGALAPPSVASATATANEEHETSQAAATTASPPGSSVELWWEPVQGPLREPASSALVPWRVPSEHALAEPMATPPPTLQPSPTVAQDPPSGAATAAPAEPPRASSEPTEQPARSHAADARSSAERARSDELAAAARVAPELRLVPSPLDATVAGPIPRVAARDPWADAVPRELRAGRKVLQKGGRGSEALVLGLRAYNQAYRDDPRGHLLLGQLYMNRFWREDALSQLAIALALDPSVRGAPEVLPALVQLVVHGAFARPAERLIAKNYGREATPVLERAMLSVAKDTKAVARLRALADRVKAPAEPQPRAASAR